MKRICFLIPSLEVGGTERQLTYLAGGLTADHEVTIVCTRRGGPLADEMRRAGVFVRVLDTWNGLGGWDPRLRGKLRRTFRGHRPDVLHTFLFGFDLAANRAARETGVPVVISSRRQLASWKKPRHVRVQRKANQLTDCIVANSRAAAEFAIEQEQAEPSRVRVIPNGLDADAFVSHADREEIRRRLEIPPDRHVIGMVANFSPVKDHPLFLRTARELLCRRTDLHFLLVGDGPEKKEVERAIRQVDLSDRFTRLTVTNDIADLYRLMDVSVLCSKSEGFPNVLLESMAAGTPVVAAAVGGITELIEDGVTGRLVQTREPNDFADPIEQLLEEPDAGRRLAEAASNRVRRDYSLEAMVNAHRAMYNELLVRSLGAGA